jgi:hypothetical protein
VRQCDSPEYPGTYSVQLRAPDRHGVFKFVIKYKRKGYVPAPLKSDWKTNNKTLISFTHLLSSSIVSLVPPLVPTNILDSSAQLGPIIVGAIVQVLVSCCSQLFGWPGNSKQIRKEKLARQSR